MIRYLNVKTEAPSEFVNITAAVQEEVTKAKVASGICCIFVPHTTAAVTINEGADSDVRQDMVHFLKRLVPKDSRFEHAEGNSDAHIKASLFGPSETVLVEGGKLVLGTWQAIYFCEFDGPRQRRVAIRILQG